MLATNACVQILIKGMDLTPQPEVEGSIADRVKLLVDTTCFTLFRCGFCLLAARCYMRWCLSSISSLMQATSLRFEV